MIAKNRGMRGGGAPPAALFESASELGIRVGNSSQKVCKNRYQSFPRSWPILPDFFTSIQIFCPWVFWTIIFLVITLPSFDLLQNCKAFLLSLIKISSNSVALKFQILWFCVSTIFHVWFRSKFDFRKLSSLLTGNFLIRLTFLGQTSTFLRNLNDHWEYRDIILNQNV